jgi:regulator of RNase E activity RraA
MDRMKDETVEKFKTLNTPIVADVFRHMVYPQQVLSSTILPLKFGWKICGRAFTQANLPARRGHDYSASLEAEAQWSPGDIIVESYWGAWGFNYALGAYLKKCEGAVVDGPYRDITAHLAKLPDFPVFCRRGFSDRSSNPGGSHRSFPTRWMYAYNVPINCAGVRVDPGDIVIGDDDGVVIVPRDIEEVVMDFAISYQEADDYTGEAKRTGKGLEEANRLKNQWAKNSGLLSWLEKNPPNRR